MIIELLIFAVLILAGVFVLDIMTLGITLYLIKRSLSTQNVLAWLQAKDPVTGQSIMSGITAIAKHSLAGFMGGSAPKRPQPTETGGLMQALSMLQAIGQMNAKKQEPK